MRGEKLKQTPTKNLCELTYNNLNKLLQKSITHAMYVYKGRTSRAAQNKQTAACRGDITLADVTSSHDGMSKVTYI
jgi:hypothetical protein